VGARDLKDLGSGNVDEECEAQHSHILLEIAAEVKIHEPPKSAF
jgi:hypothetical protein